MHAEFVSSGDLSPFAGDYLRETIYVCLVFKYESGLAALFSFKFGSLRLAVKSFLLHESLRVRLGLIPPDNFV